MPQPSGQFVVLIPAFEPGAELVGLVERLRRSAPDAPIAVVDDGSGFPYRPIFAEVAELGCIVVRHPQNRGKGAALKSGCRMVSERFPGAGVVCADCDGQHTVVDILSVATELTNVGDAIVLGARQFVGTIPFKSRLGNELTRRLVRVGSGLSLTDTQTGLRGYPAALLPWLQTIRGERFDYELAVLLAARRARFRVVEVPIETVYLDGNAGTHFRAVRDSASVYAALGRSLFRSWTARR